MQAIKQGAQVREVHLVGQSGADVVQQLAEPPDLMGDLGMRPAEGASSRWRGDKSSTASVPISCA
jgi:hypothetical protein